MRRAILTLAAGFAITGAAASASRVAPVPSRLSGVIFFSCITTNAGIKVDEEIYKIDFANRQVNNKPVDIKEDDISIEWAPPRSINKPDRRAIPDFSGTYVLDRYSGKLSQKFIFSGMLTTCSVAGRRKF